MERELERNVAKLKLQYFRHVVRGSSGKLYLDVLEEIIQENKITRSPKKMLDK